MGNTSLFTSADVRWTFQPALLHNNRGKNIELSQTRHNTVATRVRRYDYGIVCTSEPVAIGLMFKVTVLEKDSQGDGGLHMGFTGKNPETSKIPQSSLISDYKDDKYLLYIDGSKVIYKGKELCALHSGFYTMNLKVGQSLGIILTRERDLHWFVDNKWKGMVHVNDYPLDRPLWGVVDIWAQCKRVNTEIGSVSGYHTSFEGQLMSAGMITSPPETRPVPLRQTQPPREDLLHQLLQEQDTLRQQVQRNGEEIRGKDSLNQRLQGDLTQERATVNSLRTENHQLQQRVMKSTKENHQLQQQVTQLTGENQQQVTPLTRKNHQLQQQVTWLTRENHQLQEQLIQQAVSLQLLSAIARNTPNSQEIEFWQVSPDEVSIREDQVLGRGAWGYVAKGMFRGTAVAVKRVWPEILEQTTLDRIRREIRTMAQIRHPNLVLFIAAVLNEKTGPMIVTELLDISLRQAYKANRVGANKRTIFRDISSALIYLHQQREPIIHRDVSSANVLLISSPNDTWLAKLSDFGSTNLARDATTPGEGAILYTAPEAYPHPPTSPTPPPPQTTKIDVYSFGVLACEVITRVFPETNKFAGLMEAVGRSWPQIHQLILSCVSHSPQDRPTMVTMLTRLQQLESEP